MVGLGEIGGFCTVSTNTAASSQPALATFAPGVALLIPGLSQGQRVCRTVRVGLQPDLDPVDGGKSAFLGRLPEPGYPVETVVIGHRQRLVPQFYRTLDKILGVRRPVEKGKVGVTVQFGVSTHYLTLSNICSIQTRKEESIFPSQE